MKFISWKHFAVMSIALGGTLKVNAQSPLTDYEMGVNVGSMVYQGDLTPSYFGAYQCLKTSFSIFASKALNQNLTVRANFAYGNINCDEALYANPTYRRYRAFQFSTTISEFSGLLVWNFHSTKPQESYSKFTPYVFAGAGLSFLKIGRDASRINTAMFDPKSSTLTGLNLDTLHKLPTVTPVLPVGVGVRYALFPQFALAAEFNYRFIFTDYLDGFKYAANPANNDRYYGFSLGVTYTFNGKNKFGCPKKVY